MAKSIESTNELLKLVELQTLGYIGEICTRLGRITNIWLVRNAVVKSLKKPYISEISLGDDGDYGNRQTVKVVNKKKGKKKKSFT